MEPVLEERTKFCTGRSLFSLCLFMNGKTVKSVSMEENHGENASIVLLKPWEEFSIELLSSPEDVQFHFN